MPASGRNCGHRCDTIAIMFDVEVCPKLNTERLTDGFLFMMVLIQTGQTRYASRSNPMQVLFPRKKPVNIPLFPKASLNFPRTLYSLTPDAGNRPALSLSSSAPKTSPMPSTHLFLTLNPIGTHERYPPSHPLQYFLQNIAFPLTIRYPLHQSAPSTSPPS